MTKDFKANKLPKANQYITASQVRLVDQDGAMVGIVPTSVALERAKNAGLDLVEVSPMAAPPVCKILDFGKFKYESKKKMQQAKKKQKVVDIKEIKLKPNIGAHDLEIKLKHARKFIEEGEKVKITLRFRGREIVRHADGMQVIAKMVENMSDIAMVESAPRTEGGQITTLLVGK